MPRVNLKIKKGDTVEVITGREKGKRGDILQVTGDKKRVLIEKVNVVSRHLRQDQQDGGGIMKKEAPVSLSNVAVICKKCDAPVKIFKKMLDDGKKVRACKKCGEILDR